jgi:hypothetical protein
MDKKIPFDIEEIRNELMVLPKNNPLLDQICLQGIEVGGDPYFGSGSRAKIDYKPYYEKDFIYPNFDIPYVNSILKKLSMYRTRVLYLRPKVCYSIHNDPSKRIHIPVYTNENCWIIVNKEIMHLPADGNYYEIDTTQYHTALNGSEEYRVHIVGCISG